jgi:conjugative relaxase-like TrwC/TraI family protein
MLRIQQIANAQQAKSYYTASDYFLETPGHWIGKGAEMLGLEGRCDQRDFNDLCDNINPATGQTLTVVTRDGRRTGWDFNFNATKSVSIARELAGDECVEEAHREAVEYAMSHLEKDMAARVRIDGSDDDRKTGNLVGMHVIHRTTRPNRDDQLPDMSLHSHVVVFNATFDTKEDRWKAAQIGQIKHDAPYYEAIYHNRLACNLRELGYGIRRRNKSFEIAGISDELIKKFSRRSAAVEARKDEIEEEKGVVLTPEVKATLGAKTRLNKVDLRQDDLTPYWLSRLTEAEEEQLGTLIGQASYISSNDKAVSFAIEDSFYRNSVVEAKRLYEVALRNGIGSVDVDGIHRECKSQGVLLRDDEATTRTVLAEEGRIIGIAREGRGKVAPLRSRNEKQSAARSRSDIELNDEQLAAIESLATSCNVVNVVDAGQGTGKTTLLEEFGRVLNDAGVASTWLGTTHTAVEELQKVGLPAMTVAAFLHSEKAQASAQRSRIIIDESSMLAHRDAHELFTYAANHGCRIDLVGDSKQYKTPVAGHPMQLLTTFAGVKPITMSKTMRQKGKLKTAMEEIRDGKVLSGHDMLTELKMVHEVPQESLCARAAEWYLKWSQEGAFVPVISPTHAQADEIASKIREGLRARGDLQGDDHVVRRLINLQWSPAQISDARENGVEDVVLRRYGAYTESVQSLAAGDLVRTTMGGKTKDGHALRTNQRFSIAGFTDNGDTVLNNGWIIDKEWGGLVQGYVSTGQAAQGKTATNAIVVYGTPSLVATRQEGFYTPVSRVRSEVAVLTDDVTALRKAIQRQERKKSATELMQPRRHRSRLRSFMQRMQDSYRQWHSKAALQVKGLEVGRERSIA